MRNCSDLSWLILSHSICDMQYLENNLRISNSSDIMVLIINIDSIHEVNEE